MTRLLLVDDQSLLRAGFRMVLETQPDFEVVGEAADGASGVRMARALSPDVVLMDVRMPVLNGIEATRAIAAEVPTARVLVLTTFNVDEYVYEALRAGASGFLLKDARPAELIGGIRAVAAGDSVLSPSVTRHLIETFAQHLPSRKSTVDTRLDRLTDREREVLALIGRGLSNGEISDAITVAEATVKTHVRRILAKLELRDRVQVVVYAYENGIVRPGG
ncbi:response regulator [Phytomonospora endophytica]|uniref:DNA-binding NarL/FixJ family response regulator n=1 Tax=Phytomonospora endophytica TaxID=714109 RepID=A0A841FP98_9ACTN|nr:response regulator transcription factor [Phytomonospora endophytica]MBB6035067.1 DNA-binding NarL/FixJ family response regulator [Phytomonospora endophytica]GIG64186.1 DNA-binding response regulator [Phytomonospora endophytica]